MMKQYVAMVGNLSEGFEVFGPYQSFDDAAEAHPGSDVWIMPMQRKAA